MKSLTERSLFFMWLMLAVISTLFIGVSTVLSKIGIRDADPYVTGAVTNTVLLVSFAGSAAFNGSFGQAADMTAGTWLSVAASGTVLTVSWIFYFLGLKGGSISVFLAIQSLTIVFSMALCAALIGEEITGFMLGGTVLIIGGTVLMMRKEEIQALKSGTILQGERRWILFAGLSAVFASVSYVIVKVDTAPIDTSVTSFFRYVIVTAALWGLLAAGKKGKEIPKISCKTWIFILLGAAASGVGHVLVYKALFIGKAAVIMTVYRMGMVISIILSRIFLREKLTVKGWIGFAVLIVGVVLFAVGG